jgi:Tfp pilus assembly protein FimT
MLNWIENETEIRLSESERFILIELLAMMAIVGVMASVGVKKLTLLSDTATNKAPRKE